MLRTRGSAGFVSMSASSCVNSVLKYILLKMFVPFQTETEIPGMPPCRDSRYFSHRDFGRSGSLDYERRKHDTPGKFDLGGHRR